MSRVMVNQAERPSSRRRWDAALVVAACVVVLFAVVGVVSAGSFVAGKVSGGAIKPTATTKVTTTSSLVAQDIHRAQAQATAIVRQAQSAGHSIVASANARARRQANAVISGAHRQAAAYRAAVVTAPVAAPTTVPNTSASVGSSNAGGATSNVAQVPTSTSSSGAGVTNGATVNRSGASVPNLSGVPSTWLVVGYNATFPGSAGGVGTISVVNRSGKVFSGVATVKYRTGGSASASFSGLAPGESLVLPLSGTTYRGGGYQIVMSGLQ